jgi:hypothetical protein
VSEDLTPPFTRYLNVYRNRVLSFNNGMPDNAVAFPERDLNSVFSGIGSWRIAHDVG